MTTPSFCIRLPFLRGSLTDLHADLPATQLLWPGLPQPPQAGAYCPPDYPFAPREAAACLEDLRRMGDEALSGLPVGAASAGNARAARHASEMALLREFGNADNEAALKAEAVRKQRIEHEQAHKALLWAWLQEERMAELADMARALTLKSESFTRSLGVEDGEIPGLGASEGHAGAGILGTPVSLDLGLMPPWRLVAANAMYFLPPDLPILAEGPMAEDIQEEADFSPVEEDTTALAANMPGLLQARAPAWRILGRKQPTGSPPLDVERLWLVWRPAS
ncbi:hypothetical protein [Desulfovibrio sp.]|uniref:hypothetical protein n=1 Tax=Desulfovibrio sp. TaxID=885 RepID=UPI0025B87749|nr:hypothetical protein [Desulfovibrio sp.]